MRNRITKLLCTILVGGAAGIGAACHSTPTPIHPAVDLTPGAPSPRAAVQRFFDAVKAGDLQAMSVVWGTTKGPVRDNIERTELEKREVILQCYFNHDHYKILSESSGPRGGRLFHVQLTRGQRVRNPNVSTVQGPSSRWYVDSLDIGAVRDMCSTAPNNP